MSTHPYIPLYVDDYDAATAHLTPAQDGAYGRMMRLCWRTPGCSLPTDEAWIARKIRLSAAEWERLGKPVLNEFFTLHRGRLVQKRLKHEYDAISRKKSARVAAGKKGGEAKSRKTHENSASIATVLPAHACAFPEPEPEPERIEPTIINARDWSRMIAEAKEAAGDAADLTRPAMHHAADLRPLIEPKTGEPCTWPEVLDAIAMVAMRQRSKGKLIPTWKWVQADAWALRDKRLTADAPDVADGVQLRATGPPNSFLAEQSAINAEARRRVLEAD